MTLGWDAVTALSSTALVLTGAGAIYFAYRQLENDRAYKRLENLEAQIDRFDSEQLLRQRKALAEARVDTSSRKLRPLNPDDAPYAAYEVLNYFEHLGFLVRKGHLNIFDVWHAFDCNAIPIFTDLGPVIRVAQCDDRSAYCDFVELVRALTEVTSKEAKELDVDRWSEEELVRYYLSELEQSDARRPRGRPRARKQDSSKQLAFMSELTKQPAEEKSKARSMSG